MMRIRGILSILVSTYLAFECMKIDGTIASLPEKWFGVAPAAGTAAVTPWPGFGQPGYDGHESNGHIPSC